MEASFGNLSGLPLEEGPHDCFYFFSLVNGDNVARLTSLIHFHHYVVWGPLLKF